MKGTTSKAWLSHFGHFVEAIGGSCPAATWDSSERVREVRRRKAGVGLADRRWMRVRLQDERGAYAGQARAHERSDGIWIVEQC